MFEAKYKALSLTQPMAWAIFHGKDIENRTWSTKFRGRIYVHASQGFNLEHWLWLCRLSDKGKLEGCLPGRWDFIHGAIIGEVDIVDCRFRHGDMNDNLFSSWAMVGQYGFTLVNPVEYDKPIPCKGKLRFFAPELTEVSVFKLA